MELSKILEYFFTLGITINEQNPIEQQFLGVIDETNAKIEKVKTILTSEYELLSIQEIQAYERCLYSLKALLIKENLQLLVHLLKIVVKRIKAIAKLKISGIHKKTHSKAVFILEICISIKNELMRNKHLLSKNEDFYIILYKIMKYEELFKPASTLI